MGIYDVAQICLNGHVITSMARDRPMHQRDHCERCGEKTTTSCLECKTPIVGFYHVEGMWSGTYDRPSYCPKCGSPYTWTSRSLQAARDLADELDELTPGEREKLKGTLDDLIRDTPQAQTAAVRFKRYVAKAGPVAGQTFRDILTDLVSETVRKTIWGA